mmetsp:Transcript_14333/g.21719  ORF Transcript_14333/g.21719 Transcript_14333/m.21719 type:complete len:176 (+) Transcript_14333:30-557(+)
MPGKRLFKQLLLQSSALDDLAVTSTTATGASTTDAGTLSRKKRKVIHNSVDKHAGINGKDDKSNSEDADEQKIKSQLDSILFYDNAFSRNAGITEKSIKRKMDEIQKSSKEVRKMKSAQGSIGTIGNSRSSSSMNSQRRHLPTFNKKKDKERKRIQSLKDLAKQLRKRNKKKNGK